MLKVQTTTFKHSGVLNKLLSDYLDRSPALSAFYSAYPDYQGFETLVKTNPYSHFNHERLSAILLDQTHSVANTSESSLAAIKRLSYQNAYSVTTGHQLCLFTGPLYFIYKIFSTIKLAEQLKKRFPENDFVPVYWMATEDHDFEEVNHFHLENETIRWNNQVGGAVGDINTKDLAQLLPQVKAALGKSVNSKYLYELFEKAYLGHDNLAQATRYLVNELFAGEGLVIIDGNDPEFKKQFVSEIEEDLFQQTAFDLVNKSSAQLTKLGYHIQVNAREINLFYLEKNARNRIEREGNLFRIHSTEKTFTEDEMRAELQAYPERFSPNVVLRPLYQQKILPNLAYIGGPGELAYWLEFRSFFEAAKISFPILVPRNFVSILDQANLRNLQKLELPIEAAYLSEQEMLRIVQEKLAGVFQLNQEEANLRKIYAEILQRSTAIDKTLEGKVNAELQKSINALESIAGKANRAQRRKMTEQKERIQKIKSALFTGSTPRERHDNFASWYIRFGPAFFEILRQSCDPLLLEQLILIEN